MAAPHKSACSRPAAPSHPARTLPMQQRQVFSCSLCNLTLPFEVPSPPHPSSQYPPGCILQYCTCRRPYQPLRASSPTFTCSSMADAPPGPNKSHSLRTRAPPLLSPETFHNDHPHQSPCRYMRKDSFGGDNGVLCLGSRRAPPVPLCSTATFPLLLTFGPPVPIRCSECCAIVCSGPRCSLFYRSRMCMRCCNTFQHKASLSRNRLPISIIIFRFFTHPLLPLTPSFSVAGGNAQRNSARTSAPAP